MRVCGYIAFVETMVVFAARSATRVLLEPGVDRRAIAHMLEAGALVVALAIVAIVELLLLSNPPPTQTTLTLLAIYLVPSTLPLALPLGLVTAILWTGGRRTSWRVTAAAIVLALLCSAASFMALGWLAPAGNQAFRVAATGRPDVLKGENELTLGDLARGETIGTLAAAAAPRRLETLYHGRWAFAFAPLALALFALSFRTARRTRALVVVLMCCALYLHWFVELFSGRNIPLAWPPMLVAWIPNLVMTGFGAATMTTRVRFRSRSA